MPKVAGSVWISGATFRFVNNSGIEYYYTGSLVDTPAGAIKGSVWIEGFNFLYIDESGNRRSIANYANTAIPSAINGSIWDDLNRINWIANGNGTYAHSDYTNTTAFSDIPHGDSPYGDSPHGDVPHSDVPSTPSFQDHRDGCGASYVNYDDYGYSDHRYPSCTPTCCYLDYVRDVSGTPYQNVAAVNYPPTSNPAVNTPASYTPAYSDHSDAPTYVGP